MSNLTYRKILARAKKMTESELDEEIKIFERNDLDVYAVAYVFASDLDEDMPRQANPNDIIIDD